MSASHVLPGAPEQAQRSGWDVAGASSLRLSPAAARSSLARDPHCAGEG